MECNADIGLFTAPSKYDNITFYDTPYLTCALLARSAYPIFYIIEGRQVAQASAMRRAMPQSCGTLHDATLF